MASLFVYGTLMFPQVLRAVLGGNLAAEPARLTGYRRCALRGRGIRGSSRIDGGRFREAFIGG